MDAKERVAPKIIALRARCADFLSYHRIGGIPLRSGDVEALVDFVVAEMKLKEKE